MRKQLATQEGVKMPNYQLIQVGALVVPDADIPVTLLATYNDVDALVGKANDFKREGGKLSMNFEIHNPSVDLDEWDAHIWATGVVQADNLISRADVRAINLFPKPFTPKLNSTKRTSRVAFQEEA